jgi:predicted amidohydrolase
MTNRRNFLKAMLASTAGVPALNGMARKSLADNPKNSKAIRVALVQFDTVPEHIERNVSQVESLTQKAVASGARWVLFHENCLCDYTPRVSELSEEVPEGRATRRIAELAERLDCYIAFGLSEKRSGRQYISHVFVGPNHYLHHYRKTWLWRSGKDKGYRNEWVRFDPGTGPEIFTIDGVRATCFICADGEAPRCIERAAELSPRVVFYPNNREYLPPFDVFGKRAKAIRAPMLVTNRVGRSWMYKTRGGCAVFGADGAVLAKANRAGREEILLYNLVI